MENYLSLDLKNNDANWLEKAEEVFRNGRHSGPYARLRLTKPLDHAVDLPEPTGSVYRNSDSDGSSHKSYELNVVGVTDDSYRTAVHGKIVTSDPERDLRKGNPDTVLVVNYPPGSSCNAGIGGGGGCFAGPEAGAILQGYGAIDYTYDPETDNRFRWTLKGYSEEEGERMYYCEQHGGCGQYQEYHHFYEYYGILDYGNHWIEAAFGSTSTDFSEDRRLAHGNVDFSVFPKRARNAAIATATVTMNVFTSVNRLMVEYALEGCKKQARDYKSYGDSHSMDSVMHAWDQAAATYAGSALLRSPDSQSTATPSTSTSTSGALYYHLVEELAREFGVLQPEAPSAHKSIVNQYILNQFAEGKAALIRGDCQGERNHGGLLKAYLMILHKMRTPWIQGVLRAAFVLSHQEDFFDEDRGDLERGRGTAFLAALLPDLHLCSPESAKAVFDGLTVSHGSDQRPDYAKIREILEFHYECLGVTCDEVGGFLNPSTGDYYPGSHPCGGYGNMVTHRRDSVAYNTVSTHGSDPSGRTKGFLASSFFMASLLVFGASLAVLVVVVRDHARGRPIDIAGTARRLASGAVGTADYWLNGRGGRDSYYHHQHHHNQNQYSGYELHSTNRLDNGDYDLQLRSVSSQQHQTPLQQPLTSSSNNNNSNSNEDYLL